MFSVNSDTALKSELNLKEVHLLLASCVHGDASVGVSVCGYVWVCLNALHHENCPLVCVCVQVIPNYSTKEDYDRMFALGVTMYGQMTAGSYCYIGPQGIVHGTTVGVQCMGSGMGSGGGRKGARNGEWRREGGAGNGEWRREEGAGNGEWRRGQAMGSGGGRKGGSGRVVQHAYMLECGWIREYA